MEKRDSAKNILTAFLLNFVFCIIEVFGGLFTGSIAILSDAVHDFGDCLAIGFAYFLEKFSLKKSDSKYTYGYRRFSLLSAMITASILVAGSIIMIYTAVKRMFEPSEVKGMWMLIIAVFGVIINGIAVLRTAKSHSINEKAISLHLLEDVLGWIVVLVGSALIWIFDLPIIDPILSVLVSLFVLYEAIKEMAEAVRVLLEKAPDDFDTEKYISAVKSIDGVKDAHHIHAWSLDGESLLVTLHAVVDDNIEFSELNALKKKIHEVSEAEGVHHLTVQFDSSEEECEDEICDIRNHNGDCGHHHHH